MNESEQRAAEVLFELRRIIAERRAAPPEVSYTSKLMKRGVEHCAKKTGEEAVEFALAAVIGDGERIGDEAADLLYHFIVTLEVTGVPLEAVCERLKQRLGTSGLEEKARRKAT